MSLINFLSQGPQMKGFYARELCPPNQIQPRQATFQYNGTSQEISGQDALGHYIIDNAIEVTCPKDCDKKAQFWEKKKVRCLQFSGTIAVVAAAGVYLAAGPYIATAIGVAGLALAILGLVRAYQAKAQVKAWENPVTTIAKQRHEVGQKGPDSFVCLYQNKLKGTALHESEVQQIWLDWSKSYFAPSYSSSSSDTVKKFFTNNPLDTDIFNYADEHRGAMEPYKALQKEYTGVKSAYTDVREMANARREAISLREEKHLSINQGHWDLALAPLNLVLASSLRDAEAKYEMAIQMQKLHLEKAIRELQAPRNPSNLAVAAGGHNRAPVRDAGPRNVAMGGHRAPVRDAGPSDVVMGEDIPRRTAELERAFNESHVVKNARSERDSAKAKYNLIYALASAPVNIYFEGKKREIQQHAAAQRSEVTQRENNQIAEFAPAVEGIRQAFNNQTAYTFLQTFTNFKEMPEPSAPPIEIGNPPPYNPAVMNGVDAASYNAFIGQIKR